MNREAISVVQVADCLARGGKERVAVNLANGLARLGCDSHLMGTRSLGPLAEEAGPAVKVWCADRSARFDLKGVRRIARYLQDHRIDIVHSHNYSSSYLMRVVFRFGRRKPVHVFHDHAGPRVGSRKLMVLDRLFLRHIDGCIAVSEPLYERARRLFPLPADRCVLIRNGVQVFAEHHPWQGRPTVVQVANIREAKNHLLAVRTAAALRKRIPDLSWVCVGATHEPYASQVRALIGELGLSGCVEIRGECSDVRSVLRQAHVGVLTSSAEGLPMAVLEYMAEQLPVVMTDVGHGPTMLREAQAGIVVPPDSSEQLTEALTEVFADPDRARRMGRNGRALVMAKYSVDAMVQQVHSLYRLLLASRRARS